MGIDRNISMFYDAEPFLFDMAKELRANMTKPEKALWGRLNKKQILGLRFKPQHPIDKYIADFYCHKIKLIIEVDGDVHKNAEQKRYDVGRENELRQLGIVVVRFRNEDISEDLNKVVEEITKICLTLLDDRPAT